MGYWGPDWNEGDAPCDMRDDIVHNMVMDLLRANERAAAGKYADGSGPGDVGEQVNDQVRPIAMMLVTALPVWDVLFPEAQAWILQDAAELMREHLLAEEINPEWRDAVERDLNKIDLALEATLPKS